MNTLVLAKPPPSCTTSSDSFDRWRPTSVSTVDGERPSPESQPWNFRRATLTAEPSTEGLSTSWSTYHSGSTLLLPLESPFLALALISLFFVRSVRGENSFVRYRPFLYRTDVFR